MERYEREYYAEFLKGAKKKETNLAIMRGYFSSKRNERKPNSTDSTVSPKCVHEYERSRRESRRSSNASHFSIEMHFQQQNLNNDRNAKKNSQM